MLEPRAFALGRPATWPRRPLLAGVVNVTPDSFSDGGRFVRWERAVEHGLALARAGADLLDIGGESTRPGSAPVSVEEELERVLPVLRALSGESSVPLSIDTQKPEVADQALSAGATWVNDVGGLRDERLAGVVAAHGAGLVIMHMRGDPATMQDEPHYDDVVEEVCSLLAERAEAAVTAGIDPERVWVDPGIGFGKSVEHNLQLLASLDRVARLGYPVMVGASRKSFIGALSGDPVDERLAGGLAAAQAAAAVPRTILRTHDVAATRQFLLVSRCIEAGEARSWPVAEPQRGPS